MLFAMSFVMIVHGRPCPIFLELLKEVKLRGILTAAVEFGYGLLILTVKPFVPDKSKFEQLLVQLAAELIKVVSVAAETSSVKVSE